MHSLKSRRPECPTNMNKQGSESNKRLKNKQQAIVFGLFTDQRRLPWFYLCPSTWVLQLSRPNPWSCLSQPSDCRRPPSAMLWLQRSSSFSSGLVPTRLTLPTQARAVNSQDSHEWRLPRTLPLMLATILSPFSCRLQILLQAIRTTPGNPKAQWQNASVWLSPPVHSLSWYVRFHSN